MKVSTLVNSVLIILFLGLFCPSNVDAQDPQFSQFYANPIYLNPALAGTAKCPRVSLNYRNQWPQLAGNYNTYSASFDKHVRFLSGGIGIMFVSDLQGNGVLSSNSISGVYAYQRTLSRKISLKMGVQGTFNQKKLDWSKLSFGDQIDSKRGFIYRTSEFPNGSINNFVDFSGGMLLFTEKLYAGFAAHHLNQPNESLRVSTSRLPVRFTSHLGMSIPLKTKYGEKTASISPNILYQQQADFLQFNLGLYLKKGALVFGAWHRLEDSFIMLLGVETGKMNIGYSYDLTTSALTPKSGGSHEISFSKVFNCNKKDDRIIVPNCPIL